MAAANPSINVWLAMSAITRRFAKSLKGMAELQYSERLAILGTETRELRHLKADLMHI